MEGTVESGPGAGASRPQQNRSPRPDRENASPALRGASKSHGGCREEAGGQEESGCQEKGRRRSEKAPGLKLGVQRSYAWLCHSPGRQSLQTQVTSDGEPQAFRPGDGQAG